MRRERFGDLNAVVVGGSDGQGGGDGPVVVLMHGFGAPGEDLVGLADLPFSPSVRFVFPEAPLVLEGGPGRAWWMLDVALLERRLRGERIDRSEEVPPALPALRERVSAALDAIEQQLGVPRERMLVGGFSQGSMLACDVVLHAARKPAGLILLSSTLIARDDWAEHAKSCAGLPVLQTHGERDQLLPFADAERLRDLLQDAGVDLTFVAFPGAHELPLEALKALIRFVGEHARCVTDSGAGQRS